ncbi:MAG: acetate kinase, partial [Candidatus Wolframiiraptor sp.]
MICIANAVIDCMKILVLNCGSSSIKYQLIDMDKDEALARGLIAKIGEHGSYIRHRAGGREVVKEIPIENHARGLEVMMEYLLHPEFGVLKDPSEVSAVGHRVVHGGSVFVKPTLITEEVIKKLKEYSYLAPLHNPHNVAGIEAAKKIFPNVPQIAVFDTAFHQTLPEKAYMYPLPYEFYEKYGVRKYGFHGISCDYVSRRASEFLGKSRDDLKMIIC